MRRFSQDYSRNGGHGFLRDKEAAFRDRYIQSVHLQEPVHKLLVSQRKVSVTSGKTTV